MLLPNQCSWVVLVAEVHLMRVLLQVMWVKVSGLVSTYHCVLSTWVTSPVTVCRLTSSLRCTRWWRWPFSSISRQRSTSLWSVSPYPSSSWCFTQSHTDTYSLLKSHNKLAWRNWVKHYRLNKHQLIKERLKILDLECASTKTSIAISQLIVLVTVWSELVTAYAGFLAFYVLNMRIQYTCDPCWTGSCGLGPVRFLAGWPKRSLNHALVSFGLVTACISSYLARLFRFFCAVLGYSYAQFVGLFTSQEIGWEYPLRYDL